MYLLADKEFGRTFYSAHYHARSSWELLLPAVLLSSFASMCFVAGLAVFITLYDSHRIGGPLYRFRANLEAIARGDLTLVTRLRDGDELQSLTEAMNGMTESLASKVRAAKDARDELDRNLRLLADRLNAGPERSGEALAAAVASTEKLTEALNEFRVSA